MNYISGAGGGGGGGKGQQGRKQRTPRTSPDGLDSRAYAKVVDLLSEGEIQGLKNGAQSIFLNNTPLQSTDGTFNFQDFEWEMRNGTQAQTYIAGFDEILNELVVNTAVLKATPITRTITRSQVDAVRVTITVPQLQWVQNDGDIRGLSVSLRIETQVNAGSWVTRITDTITGRTGDPYQRAYMVPITGPFPVNLRVTRITDDSTDPKITNAFTWSSYTEITYQRLSYPNSALVAFRIDAEQFNSVPQRSYLIRGIKVRIPSNATVDSTTGALIYSGNWNGVFAAAQWTTDPAWCLWDLLTSTRYGFGSFLNEAVLDKWSFYQASLYCSALTTRPSGTTNDYHSVTGRHGVADGLGNFEPRFSCNVNIQTAEEAYKLVNDMCSVFRAMPYWSVGALTLSQDAPTASSYLFTLANVGKEGFNYSGSSQKTRSTVAVVKYFDNAIRDFAFEVVENQSGIAKYGAVAKEIEAFACTSRGQARRLGEWLLFAEQNEVEVVSFTASIEAGAIVRPGQVISIADPVRSGARRGGRIASATTTAITVDSAAGLTLGTTPQLSAILPSGALEQRTVSSIVGNVITVSPAFSAAPNANAPWLFQNTAIVPTTWRVLTVQEQDDVNYVVTALEYDSSKYTFVERGVPLQSRNVTLLNQIPAAPTDLSFTESLYVYQNEVRSKLSAEWRPVEGVGTYEVQWRKDSGNWILERVKGPVHEILDVTPGFFEYRIFSFSGGDIGSSSFLAGSFTALGKTAAPANVTGFTAVVDSDIGVTLNWNKSDDLDLQGYEIWQGASWGTGTRIGIFQATSAKIGLLPNGTISWWVRALDTSGTYSAAAVQATVVIGVASAPAVTGSFKGSDVELRWTNVLGTLSTQSYEIRFGPTGSPWATATIAGRVQGNVYTTKAAWVGTRRWFVAAVDLVNNFGVAGTWDGVVTAPTQPTITQQVIDNNVLLQWNDCTQTLPIDSYELRRGATWAGATVIGTKQGRFTSVFETVGGSYTYWLAGIDSAGNYGTPGSVAAVVNQPPDYQLQVDNVSTFAGTRTNAALESGTLVAAVSTTETWQTHFTSRGWNTLQDQVTAGFSIYAMPSQTTGSYEETIDAGAVLAGSKITSIINATAVAGAMTMTPTISVRLLVGDPWTNYAGVSSVFATNFRYVKIRYDFASAGGDDITRVNALETIIDAKLRNDFGTGTANAADSGGTTVNFNIAFIDVQAISVTPATTSAVIAVYDFVDVPNPTSFKVLLYNTSGTRVSGNFSWSARGV